MRVVWCRGVAWRGGVVWGCEELEPKIGHFQFQKMFSLTVSVGRANNNKKETNQMDLVKTKYKQKL